MTIAKKPHFLAQLTFTSVGEGGRHAPVSSGFRAMMTFPFQRAPLSVIQHFTGIEYVYPGDTVAAEITLPDLEVADDRFYEGLDFDFAANGSLSGHGVIRKIF